MSAYCIQATLPSLHGCPSNLTAPARPTSPALPRGATPQPTKCLPLLAQGTSGWSQGGLQGALAMGLTLGGQGGGRGETHNERLK